MIPSDMPTHSASAEQELARIIEEWTTKVQAGEALDIEECARAHPEYAAELQQLLPALELLANLSRSGSSAVAGMAGLDSKDSTPRTLGDYRILREVGRGGMGVVYEAEQISLGRRVALKVLPFAATLDPRHLQRFHNEARAAASLHHPNIVQVFAVGCERAVHFFAMQFIEGRTLAELIEHQRAASSRILESEPTCHITHDRVPETAPVGAGATEVPPRDVNYFRRVAEWILQAAEALQYAHENGIVHRDVKPANLMLDGRGKLWVTDFGLAHVQTEEGLTRTGDVVGTLRYASPEQALGKRELVDHRTDVYALGATLYELLTLRPAMEGRDRKDLCRKILHEEPRPPRQWYLGVPVDLETIVLKALAKDVLERYATAKDLADDLRRFLEHRPILARRPTLWQRASKWGSRHQGVVLAGLIGLIVALAILTVGVWLVEKARTEAVWQRDVAEENARVLAERERELRRRLYPGEVRLAHRLWQLGNHAYAREVLHRQVPQEGQEELRGFEWYYLWERCRIVEPWTLAGHTHRVYDVTFSPDGKILASASEDCTVRLWDVETGREMGKLDGHAKEVDNVWFSPDGRVLASHSSDGSIHLWDVVTRRRLNVLKRKDADVSCVWFRPDGGMLAAVHTATYMEIWDPQTGSIRRLEGNARVPRTVAFSQDGKTIATGEEYGDVKVWDVVTGKLLKTTRTSGRADTVELSSTGKLAVAGKLTNASGSPVAVLLLREGSYAEEIVWSPSETKASAVAFSPDGTRLAFGGDDSLLQIWDLNSRMMEVTYGSLNTHIYDVKFSPDGSMIAAGGISGQVKLYRLPKRRPETRLYTSPTGGERITRTNHSPDGKSLTIHQYVGPGDVIHLVERQTGKTRVSRTVSDSPASGESCYSPDGRFVAVQSWASVWLMEAATGRLCLESPRGWCVAFSPDNSKVAILNREGEVSVHALPTMNRIRRFFAHPSGQTSLIYSPDGKSLVAGYRNGELRKWNAWEGGEGNLIGRGSDPIDFLAYSPSGKLLASAARLGDGIQLWDAQGRQPTRSLISSSRVVRGIAFAPDDRTLAVAQMDDVTLLHVLTGQELFSLGKHDICYPSVAFTADGQSLITGAVPLRNLAPGTWKLIRWEGPRQPSDP